MSWDKLIGPATVVYLIAMTTGGIWWASDISVRLSAAEHKIEKSAETDGRLVRLETLMQQLNAQLERIDNKLDRRP